MLAELQSRIREAVVSGDASDIGSGLVGGRAAQKRLQVHQRHYEASLTTAILGKFPATRWLVGSILVTEAARQFIRLHPPKAPCIAEYGEGFPLFLAQCPRAEHLAYLRSFAELEWQVGHVSVAIGLPSMAIASLAAADAMSIPDMRLALQPGARYLRSSWPVDELLTLYLTESAPDRLDFDPTDVFLEARGARGEFRLNRLSPGEFAFRDAIATSHTVGAAVESAMAAQSDFEITTAFARLFADGLVVSVVEPSEIVRPGRAVNSEACSSA